MSEVQMPPLTGDLSRNADYYKMKWLPDGYPGRDQGDQVWAHPLYGAYALKDYLEQLRTRPSEELRQAVRTVAHAAVNRMDTHEDALVFWYEETNDVSRAVERHYSGLTQGYYAIHLARAGHLLDDQSLIEQAEAVFDSLSVPVDKQGVMSPGPAGPSIAEISQKPNSYILNGWQSTLMAVVEYATLTGSKNAHDLAHASASEMARLLPLYDAPSLRNSRYGLSGFVYARLVFRGFEPSMVSVSNLSVATPGEASLPIDRVGGRRWENHVLAKDVEDSVDDHALFPVGNLMRLNLVLSRISYPQVNRLVGEVTSRGGIVDVQIHRGRYDPLTTSQVDNEWVTVARVDCPPGTVRLNAPIPWDVADLVAYPTNFAKKIDDRQTNVYHMTHINRLRQLAVATGVNEHAEWADTWLRYVGEWKNMPEYEGLSLRWGKGTAPVSEVGRTLPPRPVTTID